MIGRRSHGDAHSFEEALNGAPARDEHLAELVRFAEGICAAAAVEPTPAFRDSLRMQLMAEAATVLVPTPAVTRRPATAALTRASTARPGRARRRAASLTAAAVAAAGVVGLVASSASAVPGEMLYPVKRSVESVELQLHRDDASRGSFQLAQASERLAEAGKLSADGRSVALIADTLDDFSKAATNGSSKLFTQYDATGEEKTIRKVNDFAAASSLDLSALSSQLPDGVAASFQSAKIAITDLASQASSLCTACAPADVKSLLTAVTGLAKKTPGGTAKHGTPVNTPAAVAPAKAETKSPAVATTTPRPDATTTPTASVPAAPTKTPSLTDLTDPLLGGLLGDDNQVGLVPGLLNGLLGIPPKAP